MSYKLRNQWLFEFWNTIYEGEIRLIGDENRPIVLHNNKTMLATYVEHFEVRLMSKRYDGQIVETFKLNKHIAQQLRDDVRSRVDIIEEWLRTAEHTEYYKIGVPDTDLYFCGRNTIGSIGAPPINNPVFSKENYLVYSMPKAKAIIEEYPEYNLKIQ